MRVVDLSGAFRFHNPETFAQWYKLPAPPRELAEEAVYGLPELYADQLPARAWSPIPAVYPTSVILGLRPLVESGWIAKERGIVCDCKSGASGAGKEPSASCTLSKWTKICAPTDCFRTGTRRK